MTRDDEPHDDGPPPGDATHTTLFDGRVVDAEGLFEVLYDDLRRMAGAVFGGERPDQTLQPTALVNEAFLRLADQSAEYQNREHFFAVAARCMRRVLVDQARGRLRLKRGGDRQRVTLVDDVVGGKALEFDVLELEEALERLARVRERLVQVVELRFFAGLSLEEVGQVLGLSRNSVVRDWTKARTLLARDLDGL